MNSFERTMGMIQGQTVDCLPRIPILMHFAAAYHQVSYADFSERSDVLVAANRKLVEGFAIDQLDIMSDPFRETSAFGGKITYMQDTIPRCTVPLAETKDLASLSQPDPAVSPRLKNAVDCIEAYKAFAYKKYSITGWVEGPAAQGADLRGVQAFLFDLIDDESFVYVLMDRCVDVAIEFAHAQIDAGCDTIGVGDAIASQVSTNMYERLILPHEQRLVQAIQQAGAYVRLHICGNINHLLGSIAKLKVDIIDCDSQVNMKRARDLLGTDVVLTGNLNPVTEVLESTPAKIREALARVYKDVGNPYFVNAGCEIPVGTPAENLRALCERIATM